MYTRINRCPFLGHIYFFNIYFFCEEKPQFVWLHRDSNSCPNVRKLPGYQLNHRGQYYINNNRVDARKRYLPPGSRATKRYTRIHTDVWPYPATLIGPLSVVPLSGARNWWYIASRFLRLAVTAFWRDQYRFLAEWEHPPRDIPRPFRPKSHETFELPDHQSRIKLSANSTMEPSLRFQTFSTRCLHRVVPHDMVGSNGSYHADCFSVFAIILLHNKTVVLICSSCWPFLRHRVQGMNLVPRYRPSPFCKDSSFFCIPTWWAYDGGIRAPTAVGCAIDERLQ